MTVHALMPVHNRLEMTRRFLECLRLQAVDEHLNVIVIDDGSSDGSGEFLSQQPAVTVLTGDGSLWWGGGIELGLRHALAIARPEDWVLFANNDTEIERDFLQRLLDSARRHAPAAVGSVIRDVDPPHGVLSVGASVDPWRFVVRDRVDSHEAGGHGGRVSDDHLHDVDALSGRGVLFPVSAFRAAGTMRARWLPHYFADYELSLRVRRAGYRLLVDDRAAVLSKSDYGSTRRPESLRGRYLSANSPGYLPAKAVFWWEASNWPQRLTIPLRIVLFGIFPGLRRKT